ncbi:hypothetical protein [Methylocapsa sp. S129]|uniref:hypothetical protein n=1 Tax=Methylocapsa sp. S129 TaxID=1641869 RepID=UPI00131DA646|nr:hypothetical protein [Methylocapsa sp. S129]
MIRWSVIAWPIHGYPGNEKAQAEEPMNFTTDDGAKAYVVEMGAKHYQVEVRPMGENKAEIMDDAHARLWAHKLS